MYTEEYEKRGYPTLRTIIKIILIIAFIILLFILFFKYVSPKKSLSKDRDYPTNEKNKSNDNKNKSIKSQIFSNNLEKMKDAAISYYTIDRLPKNDGESKKMTLKEMVDQKLIVKLIDQNNKTVNLKESYIKISKNSDEYILKVSLKDSEKEDYILVHLGCYSYCKQDLCEKNDKQEESYPKEENNYNENVAVKASVNNTSSPTNKKHSAKQKTSYNCKYIKGKYYDKTGKQVSELSYLKNCYKPKCSKLKGYYFDNQGNSVTKTEYERICNKNQKKACVIENNKYYDINGNHVSELNYIISCKKPICKKVNGYYFDDKGKNVTKTKYNDSCIKKSTNPKCSIVKGIYFGSSGTKVSKETYEKECKTVEYVYEYQLVTNLKLSNWSSWSNWSKTDCSTTEINCSDSDINCLYKLQVLKRKEQIGTYEKTYSRTRNIIKQTGSYKQKSCSKYNYIEINKTIYATTTTYTTINTITSNTQNTTGSWKYNGRASYSNPPKDTTKTHYIFVGADYSRCSDTCSSLPNYYYDSYTYTANLDSVSSTTSSPKIVGTTKEYKASCGEYVYKTIPIYGTIQITEKASRTEPLYGTVCYKSTKNRSVISKGKTVTKWSKYNDISLLNNGYKYTGKKKIK